MKMNMIKAAKAASPAIAKAQALLTDGSDSSLYALIILRAAKDAIDNAEAELKPGANDEFKELVTADPLRKEYGIVDATGVKIATVIRYSPRATWLYSNEVDKLARELKEAQAREQQSGVARKLEGSSETVFSIKLA